MADKQYVTAATARAKRTEIVSWQTLEDAVQEELTFLCRTNPMIYQRLYDTKSAGAYLPAQPADFLAVYDGKFMYIECKYGAYAESLKSVFSNSVSDFQLASARLTNNARGNYWIIFYSAASKKFELWSGVYCDSRRQSSKPLELANRAGLFASVGEVIKAAASSTSTVLSYKGGYPNGR